VVVTAQGSIGREISLGIVITWKPKEIQKSKRIAGPGDRTRDLLLRVQRANHSATVCMETTLSGLSIDTDLSNYAISDCILHQSIYLIEIYKMVCQLTYFTQSTLIYDPKSPKNDDFRHKTAISRRSKQDIEKPRTALNSSRKTGLEKLIKKSDFLEILFGRFDMGSFKRLFEVLSVNRFGFHPPENQAARMTVLLRPVPSKSVRNSQCKTLVTHKQTDRQTDRQIRRQNLSDL